MASNHKNFISGKSHSFDTGIAKATGSIEAAILYNDLSHWIGINATNPECHKEGLVWSYSTHRQISDRIGYINERQVKYAMDKLVDMGLVKKGSFNKNHFDRTNWYTIIEPSLQPDPKNGYERQICPIDKESKKSLRKTNLSHRYDNFVRSDETNLSDVYKEKDTKDIDTEYPSVEGAAPAPEASPPVPAPPAANAAPESQEIDLKLTKALVERLRVIKQDVKIPKSLKDWHNTMRLMREVDGRNPIKILQVIDWLASKDCMFTVLSAGSLRRKFDDLEMRMKNPIKKFNEPVSKAIPLDHDGNLKSKDTYKNYGF